MLYRNYKIENSSLSRLYQKMLESDCGVVSAFRDTNPEDDNLPPEKRRPLSKQDNLKRTRALLNFLKNPWVSITPVDGAYLYYLGTPNERESRELSFFVCKRNPNDDFDIKSLVVSAGKKFNQDAVLFIPKSGNYAELIGTSDRENAYPGLNKVEKLDKKSFGKNNEFMTKVNNRPFYFYSCAESDHITSAPEIRYLKTQYNRPYNELEPYDLEKAFVKRIKAGLKDNKQKVESSGLSRLYNKMLSADCGIITACRGEFTKRENQQRLKSLKAKLSSPSISITTVTGYFLENEGLENEKWVKETGYFVTYARPDNPNKVDLKNLLLDLGEEFEQESIFWIPKNGEVGYEIGTLNDEDARIPYHDKHPYPKKSFGKENNFMTKIGNRPFYFVEASKNSTVPSVFAMQGITPLKKKHWREIEVD